MTINVGWLTLLHPVLHDVIYATTIYSTMLTNEPKDAKLRRSELFPSSETQGQLVGLIKYPWWKFTVRSRRAPGHLLLTNQFQKRLNCPLLIGHKRYFCGQSAKMSSLGDSDVFLHDVVFLIDRHGCVARSTGKATSFPGSLFSASLSRWNRDPGCGWSRDHLSIQNRRVGGYSGTFA